MLKAPVNNKIELTLTVGFSSTYPKSLPSLKVSSLKDFKSSFREKINSILVEAPKALQGQEMIFDIASQIADVLEDIARDRVENEVQSSLQEERQIQEAAVRQSAEEAEKRSREEEKKLRQLKANELQIRLDDNLKARARNLEGLSGVSLDEEVLAHQASNPADFLYLGYTGFDQAMEEFDYVISMRNADGHTFNFYQVSRSQLVSRKVYKSVSRVYPITKNVANVETLILTKAKSRDTALAGSLERRINLEHLLEDVKNCDHANVVKLFTYKVSLADLPHQPEVKLLVTTLTEFANLGHLAGFLPILGGTAPNDMMREYFAQLLDGLEYYEMNGMVHPGLSAKTILIFNSEGSITLKIADGYSDVLSGSAPENRIDPQLPYWTAPETLRESRERTLKTPIFELGVVFLQMSVGINMTTRFTSLGDLAREIYLKPLFQNVLAEMLFPDPSYRSRAFKIITSGLLQSYGPLVELDPLRDFADPSEATQEAIMERLGRVRRESFHAAHSQARYARDFNEIKLLGRGGFGEVVKVRNKLDSQFYAVKKIVSASETALSEIIPEIVLLSRINSLHVVRYINAWVEKADLTDADQDTTTTETETERTGTLDPFSDIPSSKHDFMSADNIDGIEFGFDTDEEDGDDANEAAITDESSSSSDSLDIRAPVAPKLRQDRSQIDQKYILYIQMEFCGKATLRELIQKGLWNDIAEGWRLFKHIIDGLVYIHGAGIIHRDLKPENIFMDRMNVARIGDFGLSTTGQLASITGRPNRFLSENETTSIGTRHYIAPECMRAFSGQYTTKADMYALGVILFEMSYELKTGHERDHELSAIRRKNHILPAAFDVPEKELQGQVIDQLLNHQPDLRPSASELAEAKDRPWSDKDDELAKLLARPDSLEFRKLRERMFAVEASEVQDHLWDTASPMKVTGKHLLMSQQARETLTNIFKRHGAYGIDVEGPFPVYPHYDNPARLLDPNGLVLQMPYDLTLPNARTLSRHDHGLPKTFSFGNVYRPNTRGARPLVMDEADFDIISRTNGNLALKEAEVLKVLDEISFAYPQLKSQNWAIHINHADLLDLIFEFCRIPKQQWALVKQHLANLNLPNNTWSRIKADLRDPRFNLPASALEELGRFNVTGHPTKTFETLETIFMNHPLVNRLPQITSRLQAVFSHLARFKVQRPVLHNPLSCYSEHLYKGSVLFQLIIDAKKRRIVWAVGGRYDRLIEEFMIRRGPNQPRAVGFQLNIEEIYRALVKADESEAAAKRSGRGATTDDSKPKRVDILITSADNQILESTGVELLERLWANGFSADTAAMDELDEPHSWTIIVRQDLSAVGERSYKVRSFQKREEVDVASNDLVSHLRNELKLRENTGVDPPPSLIRQMSRQQEQSNLTEREVQVLTPQHRGKKTNRRNIIDAAVAGARELATTSANEAPIAAIETSDSVLEALRDTRLADGESWRSFLQSAPLTEQKYLQQVHDMLKGWAADGQRAAFVFNYKTKACVLYDLGRLS